MEAPSQVRREGPGLIAKKIPLRMGTGKNLRGGFVDMDLVLHCDNSTAGEYGHSMSTLDLGSAWWEAEVVMGRAQRRIFNALNEIADRSPFPWVAIHSDNDNAFINAQMEPRRTVLIVRSSKEAAVTSFTTSTFTTPFLENTEDRHLVQGTPSALSFSLPAEVRFVHFDLAPQEFLALRCVGQDGHSDQGDGLRAVG